MTEASQLAFSLSKRAEDLSGGVVGDAVPMLQIASELGIEVMLQTYRDRRGKSNEQHPESHRVGDAALIYSQVPKIKLFRSSVHSEEYLLSNFDEEYLTYRERFSIAHEIAHWLCYVDHGIEPSRVGSKDYWKNEKLMDDFAGQLIVPSKVVQKRLRSLGSDVVPNIHHIFGWAISSRVSVNVFAKQFVRVFDGIGFLLIFLGNGKHRGVTSKIIEVVYSTKSENIDIPNSYSKIMNDRIFNIVSDTDVGKNIKLCGVNFREKLGGDYFLSWRKQEDYRQYKTRYLDNITGVFWTSWAAVKRIGNSSKESNTLLDRMQTLE